MQVAEKLQLEPQKREGARLHSSLQNQLCAAISDRAPLYRLQKNSTPEGLVSGHDFSSADKANRMKRALAPAGSLLVLNERKGINILRTPHKLKGLFFMPELSELNIPLATT